MKKQLPVLENYDLRILFDAMKKSYQNAIDYHYESELLYRMRKYGHSLSFSAYGIEELGKSLAFFYLMAERINEGTVEKQFGISPEKLVERIHTSHRDKHLLTFYFSFLSHLFIADFFELMYELHDQSEVSFFYILDQLLSIEKGARKKSKNVKLWEREEKFIQELQKLKENGLYVGLVTDPPSLSHPGEIKANIAKKGIKFLGKYIEEMDFISRTYWEDNIEEQIVMYKKMKNQLLIS